MKFNPMLLAVTTASLFTSILAQDTTRVGGPSIKNLERMDHSGTYSYNISECVGYSLENKQETQTGLLADLKLLKNCSAFGVDIPELVLNVSYDTQQRLHVHIYDAPMNQYQVPDWLLPRPSDPINSDLKSTSDLSFNYISSPFEWWITRRSSGDIIFDTRNSSLPAPFTEVIPAEDLGQAGFVDNIDYPNNTALPSWPFIFENQYIQVASRVPDDANIYGLGQAVASSGFRRNNTATLQPLWAADRGDNPDSNIYGSFPFYLEHRITSNSSSASHGVFLTSAAGMDIVLREGVIEYRIVGGTLDLTFFSGPTPIDVIEQFGQVSGFSHLPPLFALGYNQCRWGYNNVSESRAVWQRLRDENIPVENMWNDIDWMQDYRNFVTDPQRFPESELRAYVDELQKNHQHWIPIIDAAINLELNSSDSYPPYRTGNEQDVFIKNPDGSQYIGQVWPGATAFADWFADKTQDWWTASFKAFSDIVPLTGVWLDMNEASSFCLGSCFSPPADLSNTSTPFFLPGPKSPITGYPEGYNSTISGTSGNITVNGTLTYKQAPPASLLSSLTKGLTRRDMLKRSAGAGTKIDYVGQADIDVHDITFPPYMLHNAQDEMNLGTHALAPNATHANGVVELDVHNLWGFMEEKATHAAFTTTINPGKRPFMISRSLFAGASKYTGAWTGDNGATWLEAERSIQGVLNFAMFQVALAGADACGFNGNTNEELCNRWMQLAAFTPFYRNHNVLAANPQEPYVWDSVAQATRIATAARYELLPTWYTLFAGAHFNGTPVVRALFMEFPHDATLLSVSNQFLIGSSILVTPVLTPNVTSVSGLFPDPSNTIWRDYWSHEVIATPSNGTSAANVTLSAPLSHIPISIRGGSVLLLYAEPKYTTFETAATGYSLLAALSKNGTATGKGYQDDGETYPVQTDGDWYTFNATTTSLTGSHMSGAGVSRSLKKATILGVTTKPAKITFNGLGVGNYTFNSTIQELIVTLPANSEFGKGFNLTWSS